MKATLLVMFERFLNSDSKQSLEGRKGRAKGHQPIRIQCQILYIKI